MAALNAKLLKEFLDRAGDRLSGRWLLVGGTLLPAVGIDVRATVDIDLISLNEGGNDKQLELMELAESLGLPVDSVNQAAAFFLKKTGFSEEDLIELHRGKSAVIYRPSCELYLRLKISRLTESDLEDCKHYFDFCRSVKDPLDNTKMLATIDQYLSENHSGDRARRVAELKEHISN